MEYRELAKFYKGIASTTKRLEKTDILAGLFRKAGPDLERVVYLAQGKAFPLWDESKIGFSSRLMIKAISSAMGIKSADVERLWSRKGDLGKVAEELCSSKKQATLFKERLTVKKVFENIRKLSTLQGQGTVNRKLQLVAELLTSAEKDEIRYVVGTILEELRIGIAEGIVKDAIAKAFGADKKEVERAYDLLADYGEVASLAKEGKLKIVRLSPGRPVKVMLALLAKDIDDAFSIVGSPAQIEYKFDGFRVGIHKDGKKIRLFTRRMEDVTRQFPDVVEYAKKFVKASSCILDCEVVGYNSKTRKYMPFQSISQRIRRKYDIERMQRLFPVEVNVFDAIYYNGKSLLNEGFEKRRKIIEKIVKQREKKIVVAKSIVTKSKQEVDKFYKQALKAGHEGVMFKNLQAHYRPGRYTGFMAKLKEVLETLDLAIVGAEWGEGKRAKWLSSYVVACRDKSSKLVEIGRVSTGVKEKNAEVTFATITRELKPLITAEKGKQVMLKPKVVVEVQFEEIQKSPKYSSGYALRFPRVKRLRLDRGISDVSSLDEILYIYKSQRGRK